MAKRSDFAQKLLDDLRLRKEKMGMAPSGQHSTRAPSADAYRNSRWSFQSSGEASTSKPSSKNIPNTEVTKMWFSTRHHRTPSLEGASQDIVPVGRTRSKEHSIDVSMALALSLGNSGKLKNIELFRNATGGEKLILHCGSLNLRGMDGGMLRPSPDQFPFLSPLQIEEISKGVQKLNMILKSCSGGLNFSRDSIDIGRELLKGAMDLEKSLRMLMSLQDASDYMAGSKGKQIKLLKGKEEDESSSDEINNWKLTKPRFSFDGSTRYTHNLVRKGSNADLIGQKQMALSHPEKLKAPKSDSNKSISNASLQFNSHRSLSCGPGSRPDAQSLGHGRKISLGEELRSFSKDGNYSTSTNIKQSGPRGSSGWCEKVRIPNVVAKLMGLEELPSQTAQMKKSEIQNVPKPKQVKGISKTMTPDVEISKKEVGEMADSAPKMRGQNKVLQEKGTVETTAMNSLEAVHRKGKKNTNDLNNPENMNPASNYSPKPHFKISKQMETDNMDRSKEFKVAKKEVAEAGEKIFIKQHIYKEKVDQSAVRKPILEHETQSTTSLPHEYCDDLVRKPKIAQKTRDVFPKEQRYAQEVNMNVPQQQSTVHRLKFKQTMHESAAEIEHHEKNQLLSIIAKKRHLKNTEKSSNGMKTQKASSGTSNTVASRSSTNFTDTEQPKEYPKGKHHEKQKLRNKSSAYHEVDRKSENGNLKERRSLKTVLKTDKEKTMPLILAPAITKPVQDPSALKVEVTKEIMERDESSKILVEEPRRIKTTDAKGKNLKQHTSFLHELEHRWKQRTGKDGAIVRSHAMNLEHHLQQKSAPSSLPCKPLTDDCRKPRLTTNQSIAAETNVESKRGSVDNSIQSHGTTLAAFSAQQAPEISLKEGLELQPILKENQSEGPADRWQRSSCNSLRWQNQATSEVDGQGSLTKNEQTLKQILMNSRHFLNTAQALFKIKISIGVLQASENVCQDEGSGLVLDCGYELLRRKGKREEAISKKMSFATVTVRCLDALIKELNGDLESLEFPSKIEGDDYDTAKCLHKMIERDVQNKNPDVNCMWDFGWNSMIFATIEKDEIIRDVEKHVLNGLINDLTRDLMNVSIATL